MRDLRALLQLVAIADSGSLHKAALRLGISEPALSRTVRLTEDRLGSPLFHRSPRGLKLTEFGAQVVEEARYLSADVDRVAEQIERYKRREAALIRVGAGASMCRSMLPEVAKNLSTSGVKIVVIEGLKGEILELLRNGDVDVTLCSLPSGDTSGRFLEEYLFDDEINVYCGETSRFFGSKSGISFDDLKGENWALQAPGEDTRVRLEERFALAGLPPPRAVLESNSISFLVEVVATTPMLGVFSSLYAHTFRTETRLHELAIDRPIWQRARGAVLRPETRRRTGVRGFIREMQELVKVARST